jgi:hypothetical protein
MDGKASSCNEQIVWTIATVYIEFLTTGTQQTWDINLLCPLEKGRRHAPVELKKEKQIPLAPVRGARTPRWYMS